MYLRWKQLVRNLGGPVVETISTLLPVIGQSHGDLLNGKKLVSFCDTDETQKQTKHKTWQDIHHLDPRVGHRVSHAVQKYISTTPHHAAPAAESISGDYRRPEQSFQRFHATLAENKTRRPANSRVGKMLYIPSVWDSQGLGLFGRQV